ncbi:fimbrial biogenesis chaperone [Henriciella marina]|uniref:hypothetical protein n=1 Tax=Henriciella marina TaxID=453851 RepID=UPI00037DC859|nr:hypothetical protein [Henriciella marina]
MKLSRLIRGGLLAFAVLAGSYIPADGLEVSLSPTSIELTAVPGERVRDVVTLTNNDSAETLSLTISLADWTIDAGGGLALLAPGDSETTITPSVRFTPAFVTLAPSETRDILIDIATPSDFDAASARRFALLASAISPDTRPGNDGLLRKIEVSSLVYLTGARASSDPAILDAGLDAQTLTLSLENTGGAHARLQGTVRIGGRSDTITLPIASLVILPGSTRDFQIPLDRQLPDNPMVTVDLVDTHAPQIPQGQWPLPRFTAPLEAQPAAALR